MTLAVWTGFTFRCCDTRSLLLGGGFERTTALPRGLGLATAASTSESFRFSLKEACIIGFCTAAISHRLCSDSYSEVNMAGSCPLVTRSGDFLSVSEQASYALPSSSIYNLTTYRLDVIPVFLCGVYRVLRLAWPAIVKRDLCDSSFPAHELTLLPWFGHTD